MASRKQNAANRRNAQLSTGPQTPEGKAAVRLNALRHGLTAQHAVISTEEQEDFNQTLRAFEDQLNPRGPLEALLVQQIVMAAWRLARLRGMETGLFELRLIDDAEDIDEDYEHLTPQTRLAYVFLHDARGPDAFTTLARYETRIERALYRALHELQRLQAARSGRDVPPPAALDVLTGEPPAPQNMSVTNQTQSPPENPPNPAPPQDLTPASISQSPNPQISQFLNLPITKSPNHPITNSVQSPNPSRITLELEVSKTCRKAGYRSWRRARASAYRRPPAGRSSRLCA